MKLHLIIGAAGAAAAALATAAQADQVCGLADELAHVEIAGEVYGGHGIERPLSDRLSFALVPDAFGYRVEVRDGAGWDLALMTPPQRLVEVNPRTIAGWHFRNADNTGPNTGEVNAPQDWRRIVFGPEALDGELAAESDVGASESGPRYGRGELQILDYGLADLQPGERARMVYLKFSACLEWSPAPGEALAADVVLPAYPEPVKSRFAACGLADEGLSNHLGQGRAGLGASYLELDIDADGDQDLAAPVVRASDGKRGIAVCRAGEDRLDLLGFAEGYGRHLTAAYFDNVDWWSLAPPGRVAQSPEEGAPPTLAGAGIVIGKGDSSSALVYWDGAAWSSYWRGD
jgi:hypothetical protein